MSGLRLIKVCGRPVVAMCDLDGRPHTVTGNSRPRSVDILESDDVEREEMKAR